ncbi:MAG: hypothetical protein ABEJ28_06950 [Salinigranum sp.]
MTVRTLFDLSVAFAIVTGTGAGLLSILSWELFRRSPLGRAIFVLSSTMSVFILYHVLLLGLQAQPSLLRVIESVAYTGVFVFVAAMVLSQRRLRRHAEEGEV